MEILNGRSNLPQACPYSIYHMYHSSTNSTLRDCQSLFFFTWNSVSTFEGKKNIRDPELRLLALEMSLKAYCSWQEVSFKLV